jgi:hypothetical protein
VAWGHIRDHVLGCLRQAGDGLLHAQAIPIEVSADNVCVGVSQEDIVKWHIQAELDRCAPWPCSPVATSPFVWSHSPSRRLSGAVGSLPVTRRVRVVWRG